MRPLKICLWLAGALCLLSIIGLFLPISTLESITNVFGSQPFPDSTLFEYLIRLTSASYAGVGIFFIILALNPMKYGIMVPFSGLAAVVLGIVCLITGLAVGMPALWYLGDSLSCIVLGALILLFWRQAGCT
ncbi:MAG: hypothetical protein ACYSSI_06225 [Planctomycetota bacterium]|jgi:hypothetical protein